MPYTPPAGSAANFTIGYVDAVRPYNGLNFKFHAGTYSPPAGNAVTLQHPLLYTPPAGSAANFTAYGQTYTATGDATYTGASATGAGVLGATSIGAANYSGASAAGQGTYTPGAVGAAVYTDYSAAGEGTFTRRVRIGSSVRGAWSAATAAPVEVKAPSVAASERNQTAANPWSKPKAVEPRAASRWASATRRDDHRLGAWGRFGQMRNGERGLRWAQPARRDDDRKGVWARFGQMRNEDQGGRWFGTLAVDHQKHGRWHGFLIPTWRPVPFACPLGSAANFNVYGGGILAEFVGDSYTPPSSIVFQFGAEPYLAPWMPPSWVPKYVSPIGGAANFLYDPATEPVLDGAGQHVLGPSHRDPNRAFVWGKGKRRDPISFHPWLKFALALNPGVEVITPGAPAPAPGESIIIPVRRFYIVLNETALLRSDDSTPIPCVELSIAFDCDSWLPTFSAVIPEAARDTVMPGATPVEVEAFVNGTSFKFLVENIQRNRQFAKPTVSISGRGVACELDAPYAAASQHTNGSLMTAQQLITAALTDTGYTQDWNITDWAVPANTFSLFGTPADVAGQVANAAGAVLAAHWYERELRMLPRYPVKPWEWNDATPDYVIPGAVTQTESLEWVEKPAYNVVYVAGVQAGVIAQVKRTGTAGDSPAPMVTHPLVTHADAGRQKGISILADTGRKALMRISLPVLDDTGVIDVCKLIEFNDGSTTRRGVVRANSLDVRWPTVRQTLTVEAQA